MPSGMRASKKSYSRPSSASRSTRRPFCCRYSVSSSSLRLWARKGARLSYSMRTSAWRMNSSRAARGSMRLVGHAPVRGQRQPEQRGALVDGGARGALLPVRVVVLALHQVLAHLLHPQRIDARHIARVHLGGLHLLGTHDPRRPRLELAGAGMDMQLVAARAEVLALLLALRHVRQQPGQQRAVDGLVRRRLACSAPSFSSPFTTSMTWLCTSCHSVSRRYERKCSLHQPRNFARDRCARCSSQARHSFSSDRKSDCSSRNGACFWSAWVCLSAGRSRGSGTDSAAAMMATSSRQPSFGGRQQHAAQAGVQRQARQPAADLGDLALVLQPSAPSSHQRALAIAHQPAIRRLDEGKGFDVAQPQRMHLQDHRGEIGALDLRLGEFGPGEVVLFRIQPDGDARTDATRNGPSAGWPKPARSSRWAGAAGGCDGCSG